MASKYIQISTTVSKKSDAEKIAKVLSEKHLSACTQIIPVTSVYQWKGKLEKTKELLLVVKTKSSLFKKVEAVLKEVSPYELPEIIATPIIAGSSEYLAWMEEQLLK